MTGRDLSTELYGSNASASSNAPSTAGRDLSADLYGAPAAGTRISLDGMAPVLSGGASGEWDGISKTDRMAKGLRDPIDGAAQLLTNMLPAGIVNSGNKLNNLLADKTGLVERLPEGGLNEFQSDNDRDYEARRLAGGETGFDGYRVLGNLANPVNYLPGALLPKVTTLASRVAAGAGVGALTSALAPVSDGDFANEKTKQIGMGVVAGGVMPILTSGAARVISPNASTNSNLSMLKDAGVNPTIGQSLGGRWNALEEKMSSLPLVGDMISKARGSALEQFNNAAINRASGKVGVAVQGSGQSAIADAGNAVSKAYDDALSQVKYLKFDQQFASDVGQLKTMAQGLTGPMRSKFNSKLEEVVGGRMSGTGSMLGETYKKVDSEIGGLAAKYQKSAVASESELGDAFAQLQNLLKQQAVRSNPEAAKALKAADSGWANLVRVEGAGKAAQSTEGLFTPAQLNMAIRQADQSTRGRAVSRGAALMQDMGNAGQQVLGNKVPNSFTTDRAIIAGGGLGGAYLLNPAIPAGLLGAAAMYTTPMQGLLRAMVSARPEGAQPIADALRKTSPGLGLLGSQVGAGLLNGQGNQ